MSIQGTRDRDRRPSGRDETHRAGDDIVREHFRHASTSWGMRYQRPRRTISDQDLILRRENVHRVLNPLRDPCVGASLRIVDVGCGTGNVLDGIPRGDRVRIIGVDFVLDMVRRAAASHPEDMFVTADVATLPLAPESQDVAVCIGVLEYVTDPTAVLRSIHSVLRPGGHLIVSFANQASAFRLLGQLESRLEHALQRLLQKVGWRQWDDDRPRYRHRQWTVASARRLLVATGFKVDQVFFNTFGLPGHTGPWGPNLAFSEWMSRRYFANSRVSTCLAMTIVIGATRTGVDR